MYQSSDLAFQKTNEKEENLKFAGLGAKATPPFVTFPPPLITRP